MATDASLLEAWRDGDRDAGRALYDRHARSLYRFFRNKVDGGVDDLLQETFLALVEGRDRFRGDASVRTYLFVIARRLLRAHWERSRRDAGRVDVGEVSVAALSTSPSGLAARAQEHRLLAAALRRLPMDQQIVIELHYWEELSGSELAEVLGVPEGTVRSRLARAREQLLEEIHAAGEDAELVESTRTRLDGWVASLKDAIERE
jgi:RNA polymerase sigma-70 factor (ECF subfamily)